MTSQLSPERLLGVGMGFWGAKALLSAVELGVFTRLGKGRANLAELTEDLGLHERGARDFFDALVAMKLLDREDGVYGNTPETDLFLDRAKPSYVGGILEMANARLYATWGRLTHALRTGRRESEDPADEDFFGALYADPDRLRGFLAAMSGVSAGPAKAIAAKIPWRDYKSFVDVGAAQGMVPVTIARAHPHLAGAAFDLPAVGPIFEEFVARNGLSDRLRFMPGDFFKDKLPTADVMIMGHILHDWGMEEKRVLLAKAYEALPKGGLLVVYEALIDDDRRENAFGLLMSLNMLIETPGGFDYTGADCQNWMREAGFAEIRVEHLLGPDSMVIGVK
ncbi:acetylserotonin O-methyltransferase [Rhodoblastus acidophilus]|uniref:Acetylserotonin O-methyltransferase n=1 Tax=Candidatus Rhodoblastus alkanivorans TaxID=2954117 RepID=A0ABS9Z9E5_9HYPH|nr:acetylserotonin O-methyltransferase [Candidatus Rhodoblastus alkanivorans]MCI4679771.1 acetylserotonin O-methyltransferase [Candidatus Rhodoblastus alkanivorans]MCI4684309.1 acetylserotonin O-methyltransferase [Candidatus Rhodoblastus alkanivorans]MDI4641630.1 acetylserotonin O-methyltransferase [Rhodoblastus acidophilus]